MNGYILTTTQNTHGWVVYENDISTDYQNFFKGDFIASSPTLFYRVSRKTYLKKVEKAILLESSGPELVSRRLKEVLEATSKSIQFFDAELFCEGEKIEGFYAANLPYKINCVDIEHSEFRLTNFDPQDPEYMFYYMRLRDNLFKEFDIDIVRCREMHRCIVVNEKIKKALFDAGLKGLQFSDSIDMTPQERSIVERI
jgi:hypothetical protein